MREVMQPVHQAVKPAQKSLQSVFGVQDLVLGLGDMIQNSYFDVL